MLKEKSAVPLQQMLLNDGLFTIDEIARAFRVGRRTISNWKRRGIIPCVKFGEGDQADVRFNLAKVKAALEERWGRPATAPKPTRKTKRAMAAAA